MSEMPEYFDLYDIEGDPLGQAKARAEVHRDGDWHRSSHVWVFTSDGCLLFQRRAPDKDTWPRRLDASIGGHYHAGEEGPIGVVREAEEELGLAIAPEELVALGLRRVESIEPGVIDRELQDIYLLRRDLPLVAYRPDPVEIDGLVLLDAAESARLHAGTIAQAEAEALPRGSTAARRVILTADDLIPDRGPYLTAVAQAVGDVLAGRTPLAL